MEDLQIVAGELDVSEISGTEQIRSVSRIKLHPNYNGEDYNIAVVTVIIKKFNEIYQCMVVSISCNFFFFVVLVF